MKVRTEKKVWGQVAGIAWVVFGMLALAGCSREGTLSRHLKRGAAYAEKGQSAAAIIEYMNALQADRTNQTALVGIAEAYLETGEALKALPFLYTAGRQDPDDLETRIKAATILRLAGRLGDAREIVADVLVRDSNHLEALVLWGDTAVTREERLEAIGRFEAIAEAFSDESRYFLVLGGLYLKDGRISSAEVALKQGLALEPESVPLLMGIGEMHRLNREPELAEKALAYAAKLSPPASLARVQWADYLYLTGQAERARVVLQEALDAAPEFEMGWERMGLYALAQRRLDDADDAVRAILTENPDSVGGLLLRGNVLLAQGEGEQGLQVLEDLAGQYPHSAKIRHQLGMALLREGRVEQARAELRKAVDLEPDSKQVVLQWASLSIRVGAASEVISDLQRVLERDSNDPEAAMLLGSAYLAIERPAEALALFQKLTERLPDSHVGPFLLADAFWRLKRDDEAIKANDEALRRFPGYVPALVRRVAYDLARGKPDEAIARIQARIEATPDQRGLRHLLGRVYVHMGATGLAAQSFREEIQRHPRHVHSYLELVRLLARDEKVNDALAQVEAALGVDEKDVSMLMLGGMLSARRGAYEDALSYYHRLLAVDPDFSMAANNAAYIYSSQFGDLDRAYALARRARDVAPREATIADTLGWIVYLRGEYPWALTLIREGAEEFTEHPDVQYHLGMALLAMGKETDALVTLNRAAELAEDGWEPAPLVDALRALLRVPVEGVAQVHRSAIDAVLALDPNNPSARVRQVALLAGNTNQNTAGKALSAYQGILESHPNFLPATLRLIDLYDFVLDDRANAVELAQQARDTWPQDPRVAGRAGWLALREGNYAWAHGLLQESAQLLPEDPASIHRLALATYYVGQVKEAEQLAEGLVTQEDDELHHARAALKLLIMIKATSAKTVGPKLLKLAEQFGSEDPLYPLAQMVIARGHTLSGDAATAVVLYSKVLERTPAFGPAVREAAWLYTYELKDNAKAYPLAVRAREALPEDGRVACILGRLVYERGNYSYAAGLLEEGLRDQPDDGESWYLLGFSRHQQGDAAGARDALAGALQRDPTSIHAPKARQVIAELK